MVFESKSIEFSLRFDAEERGLAKEKSKGGIYGCCLEQ